MKKPVHFAILLLLLVLSPRNAGAWGRFDGGHHPDFGGAWARPNPVVIHRTYVERTRGGCIGCGVGLAAVAGLVGGAIVGAAIASSAAPPPQIDAQVAMLPPGCAQMNVNGTTLYQCGPVWYQPFFGGNGVYYAVVPAP